MATTEETPSNWKPIASMTVLDGRQYENNNELDYSKSVHYAIKPIGNYVGGDNSEFLSLPKDNELPRLIPNIQSLIDEDLNKGFKQVFPSITNA